MKSKIWEKILNFKKGNNFFIIFTLIIAFVVRVFRINKFLGFYYDQGRDALVIWNLIHKGKFFLVGPLIGPTMGMGDIPRGPWYYWLITPFYWFGRGNPIYPSIFLIFTTVLSIYFLFLLTRKVGGKAASYLALIIAGFSFNLIMSSHWLANPTLIYLISILFFWSLIKIVKQERGRLPLVFSGLLAGLAMQFSGAADMFYLLIVFLVVLIWARKLINLKNIISFLVAYAFPFLPQILFDLRHNGILRKGIIEFLHGNRSFTLSVWKLVKLRFILYFDVFSNEIWYQKNVILSLLFVFLIIFLVIKFKEFKKNDYFLMSLLFLAVPLFGMLFFRGDKGVIYGYYFAGYYLIFILIFSVLMGSLLRYTWGKVLVFGFLALFFFYNISSLVNYYSRDFRSFNPIILEDQIKAIDWVFKDAGGEKFNVDVYVPPVIPYAYDYLFLWQANKRCGKDICGLIKNGRVGNLYTLYEIDPPHPERLEAWLERQKGIGVVEKEAVFGGITVQKRNRI